LIIASASVPLVPRNAGAKASGNLDTAEMGLKSQQLSPILAREKNRSRDNSAGGGLTVA